MFSYCTVRVTVVECVSGPLTAVTVTAYELVEWLKNPPPPQPANVLNAASASTAMSVLPAREGRLALSRARRVKKSGSIRNASAMEAAIPPKGLLLSRSPAELLAERVSVLVDAPTPVANEEGANVVVTPAGARYALNALCAGCASCALNALRPGWPLRVDRHVNPGNGLVSSFSLESNTISPEVDLSATP